MIRVGGLEFELGNVRLAELDADSELTVICEVKPASPSGSLIAVVSDGYAVQDAAKKLLDFLGAEVSGDVTGSLRKIEPSGNKLVIEVVRTDKSELTGAEAARVCGVSKSTIYRLLNAGSLSKKDGKFSRKQCLEWRRARDRK